MQPLNAIDAIAPAFTRTHETLAHPFRIGRAWKLCASQYLAVGGSMFIPYPLFFFFAARMAPAGNPFSRVILLVAGLFYTVLLLLLLYFGGRMELVAFEMLVTRAKFIAPMWRRYSARMWPWLGWKVVVGTIAALVVCGAAYVPLKHAMSEMAPMMVPMGPKPDPIAMQNMVKQIVRVESVFFALFFLLKIPSTLFNDFVLPFFVLEDISMATAIKRGLEVCAVDPLQIVLYIVMKPILFIVGCIMLEIAVLICSIPFIIIGVIGVIISSVALGHNNPIGIIAMVLAMIAFYGFIFWVTIGAFGYLMTLLEAYGIYFLGGRYPLLGNMLEPGPGYPFTPPPVFPLN